MELSATVTRRMPAASVLAAVLCALTLLASAPSASASNLKTRVWDFFEDRTLCTDGEADLSPQSSSEKTASNASDCGGRNLFYNRFRYYDPAVGRYVSPDPLGITAGLNVYAHLANTTGRIDVFGLSGTCIGRFRDRVKRFFGRLFGKRIVPATAGGHYLVLATKPPTANNRWGHSVVGIETPGSSLFVHQVGVEPGKPLLGGFATEVVIKDHNMGSYNLVRIPISESAAAAGKAKALSMLGPSGPYNILTNSCATTSRSVMKAAGMKPPWWSRSPSSLQRWSQKQ